MKEEKSIELKRVDVFSVFRFFGGTFLIVGLIIGLFGNLLRIDIMSTLIIRAFPFLTKFGRGIFMGVAYGIIYGLSGGIGFTVSALLYNFFAALFGGIKIYMKE